MFVLAIFSKRRNQLQFYRIALKMNRTKKISSPQNWNRLQLYKRNPCKDYSDHKKSNLKLGLRNTPWDREVRSHFWKNHPTSLIFDNIWATRQFVENIKPTRNLLCILIYIYMYIYTYNTHVKSNYHIIIKKIVDHKSRTPPTTQIKKMSSGLKVRSE